MHIYDNVLNAKITDCHEIPLLIWECQSFLESKIYWVHYWEGQTYNHECNQKFIFWIIFVYQMQIFKSDSK
jgi:hypothetical protein